MGRKQIAIRRLRTTTETKRIEELIDSLFPNCPRDLPRAYRFNSASIRVRIVDECFRGKSRGEREEIVRPLLERLADETQQDIVFLLLLAPEELEDSMMNREYEDPRPSQL